MQRDLERALRESGGLVLASPSLASPLARAVRAGEVRRILPTVYGVPEIACRFEGMLGALLLADPDAVVMGRAAAALTWWPELTVQTIEAVRRGVPTPVAGFAWTRRSLPIDHVVETPTGVRVTDVATTVLDLIPALGGDAIDEALRRKVLTLDDLWNTLADLPRRPGDAERRRLLWDSRDEPWSEAERAFHRLLREAKLPFAFSANQPVAIGERVFHPDAAIEPLRLAFEVDGYAFHSSRSAFTADRCRDILFELAGWRTHRFAADWVLEQHDTVVGQVTCLVAQRAAELGFAPAMPEKRRRTRRGRAD